MLRSKPRAGSTCHISTYMQGGGGSGEEATKKHPRRHNKHQQSGDVISGKTSDCPEPARLSPILFPDDLRISPLSLLLLL